MQDDVHKPLRCIRAETQIPLTRRIAELEEKDCFIENQKSAEFMRTLKCFVPGYIRAQHGTRIQKVLHQTSSRSGYVALSWTWRASEGEDSTEGGYRMMLGGDPLPVRDVVLDRTTGFLRYLQRRRNEREILPLWIDKLSINQSNETEKLIEMQSMDLVYKHCESAVGYIWTEIKTRRQLSLLVDLLEGRIVGSCEDKRWPVFASHVDRKTAQEVLTVLLTIIKDHWWNRAWIFQEDHIAGLDMWLLIRHPREIDKRDFEDTLGDIPGEITFRSVTFKQYASLFCLAYPRKHNSAKVTQDCNEILQKAGKYNVLHRYNRLKTQTMTLNIVDDLASRDISKLPDILAIIANACQYSIRIDLRRLAYSCQSLSLAIIALLAANGELLRNDRELPEKLSGNMSAFLKNHAVDIDPPVNIFVLTFKKHCRRPVSHLSRTGVHTQGLLWEIGKTIQPSEIRRSSAKVGSEFENDESSVLLDFAHYLRQNRYRKLASDLEKYLEASRSLGFSYENSYDEWPSSWSKDIMAACVAQAIQTGKCLRLGRLYSSTYSPYRAIFVCDENHWPSSNSLVFTSWDCTKRHTYGGWQTQSLAKYVSMGVEMEGETGNGVRRLRTREWVNGLCFFDGEETSPYVFPWPESLFS